MRQLIDGTLHMGGRNRGSCADPKECDAELTIRALKKHHLANGILHVENGQKALEFLFGTGVYAGACLERSAQGRHARRENPENGRARSFAPY